MIYNKIIFQNYNDPPICGHLCLTVLKHLSKENNFKTVMRKIEVVKEKISYIKNDA